MITMQINYDLIGTHPEVDMCAVTLKHNILHWTQCRPGKLKEKFRVIVEKCAEHFFGLSLAECGSMTALVDAMKSMDQELEVRGSL